VAHPACRPGQAGWLNLSASDVIRYALTSLQERLPEEELWEAVIKHVHSEAKLYPGRARRGLPPDSASDAPSP